MSYLYSEENRLENPHHYMYTQFQGEVLLREYQDSRLKFLRRLLVCRVGENPIDLIYESHALSLIQSNLGAISAVAIDAYTKLIPFPQPATSDIDIVATTMNDSADLLSSYSQDQSILTLELLQSLLANQLLQKNCSATKVWLDRVVQRFEVTKKIYWSYPPGFRKGEGHDRTVRLYWLFAMVLCVQYINTQQIKYLSTLLKVNDLLCSLPDQLVSDGLSYVGMSAIVAAELVSIQLLASKKGVSFDTE